MLGGLLEAKRKVIIIFVHYTAKKKQTNKETKNNTSAAISNRCAQNKTTYGRKKRIYTQEIYRFSFQKSHQMQVTYCTDFKT